VNSAFTIAKVLRKNFKEIKVFIPQIAASGATLIAIAANEIVMGMVSKLSPIDPIIHTPHGKESCLATVRGFDKLSKNFATTRREDIPEDIPYPQQHLIETVNLPMYEERRGLLNMVYDYAYELLKLSGYGEEESKNIAEKLVFGYPAHYYILDFDKVKELGLNVKWYEELKREWVVMRKWLGKYIFQESAIHHIVYAFPERRGDNEKS